MLQTIFMPENEQFQYLKAYYMHLLPSLTEENWKVTEQVLKVRTFKKGELIVKEGLVCNNVSFINKGLVKMYFMVNGKEKIIGFCNELNYICDYQSFLTRKPANSYVQALENTEVVETSFDDLQMIYEKVPEANKLGRKIAEGLFLEMCEANHSQANETIIQRYRKVISDHPWLMQRVPQYMIASYLGITPEALSRIKSRVHNKKKSLVVI